MELEYDYDTHLKPSTQIKKEKGEDAAIEYLFKLLDSKNWNPYGKYAILDKARGYYKKAKNQEYKDRIEKELISLSMNYPDNSLEKSFVFEALVKLYQTKGDYENAYFMTNGAISAVHPEDTSYCIRMHTLLIYKIDYFQRKGLSNRKNAIECFYWDLVRELYMHAWEYYVTQYEAREKNYQDFKEGFKDYIWDCNPGLVASFQTLVPGKNTEDETENLYRIFFEEFPKLWVKGQHQTQIVSLASDLVNNYMEKLVSKEI